MHRLILRNLSLTCDKHINNSVSVRILRNLDLLGLVLLDVFGHLVNLLWGVMGFVSLRDLLDDPELLFDIVDGVLVHEALRLLRGSAVSRTDRTNELCSATMQDSRCLSAPGCCTKHVCLRACRRRLSFVGGLLVEQVVGHPRLSLSGTGVLWVSCLDSLVCLRVQDDPEAKSQPGVVLG